MSESTKRVFVSWTHYSRRSESVARAVGAEAVFVERLKPCPVPLLPFRYLVQAVATWKILRRMRPAVIGTMNPPIVLPLVVALYCRCHGAVFFMDSHTGAFIGTWGRFGVLHRILSRRAVCEIVTNESLGAQVRAWGGTPSILEIEIPGFSSPESASTEGAGVCVVNSFSDDEPLEEILEAARLLAPLPFSITGRITGRARATWVDAAPANVTFTDYIGDGGYRALLQASDIIVVLVRFGLTLLQGGAEAVAFEKPLVTSDWPVLKRFFSKGTVTVDNSARDIARGVQECLQRREELGREMAVLKQELGERWREQVAVLREMLVGHDEG